MPKKYLPKAGERVSCYSPVEAYYSNYGGQPFQEFVPGMVGVVGGLAPYVWVSVTRGCRCEDFAYVDFTGDNGDIWRVALDPHNIAPAAGQA